MNDDLRPVGPPKLSQASTDEELSLTGDAEEEKSPYAAPAQDPAPMALGAPQAPDLPYPKNLLVDALSYPFRGNGKYMLLFGILLAGGVGVVWLIPILGWIAAMIVWAMVIGMCCNILMISVNYPEREADWPDFSDAWSDLIVPLLRFVLLLVLCLLIPVALVFWLAVYEISDAAMFDEDAVYALSEEMVLPLTVIILLFGSAYLAFSMLAMNMLGTFSGLMPHKVIGLFCKSMPQSWYIIPILLLLSFVHVSKDYLAGFAWWLPFLLVAPINVYFFMVIARFLGRLFGLKQDEIDWFTS